MNNLIAYQNLNIPIGYASNPIPFAIKRKNIDIYQTNHKRLYATSENQSLFLDNLPFEILFRIANHLSQFDCLSLILTNRYLYESVVPRVYQHIIIDETHDSFLKEYTAKYRDEEGNYGIHLLAASYVTTTYNFKKLLANLTNQTGTNFSSMVRKFHCIRLPESLNLYDHQLNDLIKCLFRNLRNTKELIWMDDLKVSFLRQFPNSQNLKSLIIKMDNDDVMKLNSVDLNFPSLTNFQLTPFRNSSKLEAILRNLVISRDSPSQLNDELTTFKISRTLGDNNGAPTPPCKSLVVIEDPDVDLNTIQAVHRSFNNKRVYLSNLQHLSLCNVLVRPEDFVMINEIVDLSKISILQLNNVSEVQKVNVIGEANQQTLSNNLKPSFLIQLASGLNNLSKLSIDYREGLVDTVYKFLQCIPRLIELDIVIRYNSTKLMSWSDLSSNYIDSIISHSESLMKLSIEVTEENPFCNLNKSFPSGLLLNLASMKSLKSLRLNEDNFKVQIPRLVSTLRNLKFLDLSGKNAGGPPHMGLEVVHQGIFDDWLKVQHVAYLMIKENTNIEYVRVNQCVFEITQNGEVVPRDGINGWFDGNVRVGREVFY